jgi:cytochrome c-type biogenesis protein
MEWFYSFGRLARDTDICQSLSAGNEYRCCILYFTPDYAKEYYILVWNPLYLWKESYLYRLWSLIVKTLVDVPILSDFLQRYVNKILGILLILVGMILLDLLRIPVSLPSASEDVTRTLVDKGAIGSFPLGILFALAFCPVSAALFFGGLIPIAVKAQSEVVLPLIYGVGTGLPVLLFAFVVAAGAGYINNLYHGITKVEFYTKKATGIIFILAGIYYALAYIFEIV